MFFFFNDTATTEIYTLSLHDALPIYSLPKPNSDNVPRPVQCKKCWEYSGLQKGRSEEHTSELQSRLHLVCRLLLEKKKNYTPHCLRTHTSCPRRLASLHPHTLPSAIT